MGAITFAGGLITPAMTGAPNPSLNPHLIAVIVASANFMGGLDATVVLTALPQMAKSFGVQPVDLSIGVIVYLMIQAVLLPISSWIADRLGPRNVLATAILGFTAASVLCAFSHSLWEFVGARVLQASFATLMVPVGRLVLLRATDRQNLISVINIQTIPSLTAPMIGPALGGFIVTFVAWPWIFLLNIPIGLIGAAAVMAYIPNLPVAERRPFDFTGFWLSGGAVGCLIWGADRLGARDADWRLAGGLILAGLALGVWAVAHMRRAAHPIVPLEALRIRAFTVTTLTGGFLMRIAIRAIGFILPLMFQVGLGMSAFVSGLLVLGLNGGDLILKTVATRGLRLFGFWWVMVVGAVATAAAVGAAAFFTAMTPLWIMFATVFAMGMFRSLLFTGMVTLSFAETPEEDMSGAIVISNMAQQTTGALGVSLSALLMNLTATARGGPQTPLGLIDCRIAMAAAAVVSLASVAWFWGLPRDVGSEVRGHAAHAVPPEG